MKKNFAIGLAFITAGTMLAACDASNNQATEKHTVETATTTEKTPTEEAVIETKATTVMTTESASTATTTEIPTEAWMTEYASASVMPRQNPDDVWGNEHKIEIRLNNGMHLYIPSFFDNWYEGAELMFAGYGIRTDGNYNIPYFRQDADRIYSAGDYFEVETNTIYVGATEDHLKIKGELGDKLPSDGAENHYREIAVNGGRTYYIDFSLMVWDGGDSRESYNDFLNKFEDKIINSAWVE